MLAIAGGKGGCGKTTTTLGLARALDGTVVAADVDTDMPDLHLLADVDREPTVADAKGRALHAVGHRCNDGDVTVLPAPTATDDTPTRGVLEHLSRADEPVVLDCPAGAGPDAAAPLRAADGVVLVSTLCAPALRDTAKTAAMARALGVDVVGAVVTRCRSVPEAVVELLGCEVLATVPRADYPVLAADRTRAAYGTLAARLGKNYL